MKLTRNSILILCAWTFFVGGFLVTSMLTSRLPMVENFSYVLACVVPLFCNTFLLWNAASHYRRQNGFWMLLALGCTLWLSGILVLVYTEFGLHHQTQPPFAADLLFFLHTVPFMAAIALMPHARKMRETLRFGLIDLLLLGIVWLYIYIFAAMPWKSVQHEPALFHSRDVTAYFIENLVVAIGFGILFFRAQGSWRKIYGNLFGAFSLYISGIFVLDLAIRHKISYDGYLLRLPMLCAFVWIGVTGIIARDLKFEPEPMTAPLKRVPMRLIAPKMPMSKAGVAESPRVPAGNNCAR